MIGKKGGEFVVKKTRPDWKKIATEYITGDISMKRLAEKRNVPLRTLKDRAKRELWSSQRAEYRLKTGFEAVKDLAPAPVPDVRPEDRDDIERVFRATDLVMDKVVELLETRRAIDGKELQAIMTTIEKAKAVKMLRSALDVREQEARIKALEKENVSGDADPVEICFSPEAEEASI